MSQNRSVHHRPMAIPYRIQLLMVYLHPTHNTNHHCLSIISRTSKTPQHKWHAEERKKKPVEYKSNKNVRCTEKVPLFLVRCCVVVAVADVSIFCDAVIYTVIFGSVLDPFVSGLLFTYD